MEIIGLSGFARTGKDEAAKVLVEEFGFTQIAFADRLRSFLYDLNPIVRHHMKPSDSLYWAEEFPFLKDVIDEYGWDGYKETVWKDEIRRLLQRLGTEAGRQNLGDTIWIDSAFRGLPDDAKIVVSDPRFFNEFDAIRARGGQVWRVNRPGVGPLNDHASENEATDYPHFYCQLLNDGTLDDYREQVRMAYELSKSEWG